MSLSTGDNPKAGALAVTTSAVQLNSNLPCIAVLIQADQGNSNNLLVGDANSQPINLKAGQAITVNCSNLNQIYVAGSGGNANVNWLAVR